MVYWEGQSYSDYSDCRKLEFTVTAANKAGSASCNIAITVVQAKKKDPRQLSTDMQRSVAPMKWGQAGWGCTNRDVPGPGTYSTLTTRRERNTFNAGFR